MGDVVEFVLRLNDQASAPLGAVAASAGKTGLALDHAAASATKAGIAIQPGPKALASWSTAATDAGKSAQNLGRGAQMVAVQLPDIATQLAAGVSPLTVFIQQGGQLAQQFMMIGGAGSKFAGILPRIAPSLGLVGVAVAALGGAYMYFKSKLDDANATGEKQLAQLDKMVDLHRKVKEAVILGAVAQGTMTQAQADEYLVAQQAGDLFAERRKQLQDERSEIQKTMDARTKAVIELAETTAGLDSDWVNSSDWQDAMKRGQSALADSEHQLAMNGKAMEILEATQDRYTQAVIDSKNPIESQTDLLRAAKAAVKDLSAAFAETMTYLNGDPTAGLEEFAAAMVQAGVDAQKKGDDEMKKSTADRMNYLKERLAEWTEANKAALAETEKLARAQAHTIGTAVTAGAAVATGDVQGAIGAVAPALGTAIAGPVGAAVGSGIATAIDTIVTMGEMGAREIGAQIDEFSDNLVKGLGTLPRLIGNVLPEVIGKMIPQIVVALAENVIPITIAIGKAYWALAILPLTIAKHLGQAFADWWGEIGGLKGIARSIADGIKEWWSNVKDWIHDLFTFGKDGKSDPAANAEASRQVSKAQTGVWDFLFSGEGFAKGGQVNRTGLAMVHAGERVVRPEGGPNSQTGASFLSSPPVNIYINASVVDRDAIPRLVSAINREMGRYGRRTSPILGGA